MSSTSVVLGCGDIGKRLTLNLFEQGADSQSVIGTSRSGELQGAMLSKSLDLDCPVSALDYCFGSQLYYLIPPQGGGLTDERSRRLLSAFEQSSIIPKKAVVLSTTGVYGDCAGAWVDESSPCEPSTERAIRRRDSELQWLHWGKNTGVPVVIIRVPGIYAHSRIPRQRLQQGTPVVRSQECGFTNRIHADDLSNVLYAAMRLGEEQQIYNASDGYPGKLSDFLQAASLEVGLPPMVEISMEEAKKRLSKGMLSYLSESRRISNEKMLSRLKVELRYPDFTEGLKHG